MKRIWKAAALWAGLCAMATTWAQPLSALGEGASVSGAQFLRLGAGARALGMGEAYTALATGADSLYWNPAGLAHSPGREFAYTHMQLFGHVRHEFAALAWPVANLGTFGLGLTQLNQDSLSEVDKTGAPTGGSFSPNSLAVAAAYGTRLELSGSSLALGASFKFVQETLQRHTGSAFAADIGARIQSASDPHLILGAAVRNLGTRMRFIQAQENLPRELGLGAAYRIPQEGRLLVCGAELALPENGMPFGKLGLEYEVPWSAKASWSLRAGYKTLTATGLGPLTGLSYGAGLRYDRVRVDMGLQHGADLGMLYRFSVAYLLGDSNRHLEVP